MTFSNVRQPPTLLRNPHKPPSAPHPVQRRPSGRAPGGVPVRAQAACAVPRDTP